jgi:hypothetical protein
MVSLVAAPPRRQMSIRPRAGTAGCEAALHFRALSDRADAAGFKGG